MADTSILQPFAREPHDHARCVATALQAAESTCGAAGLRLTPLRRRVLELIWGSHTPVKAYDLLASIAKERHQAAPPTVYRALDFLQGAGLVHRIASQNAYVGCGNPATRHAGQFLLCTECGSVAEIDDPSVSDRILSRAQALGFAVTRETIEVEGHCRRCRRRPQREPRVRS